MNTYEEGRQYLYQIGIDMTKITQETSDSVFSTLNDVNINPSEIKLFVALQTPPENILKILGLNSEYFEGKQILDLGGGFGGMPFLLEEYIDQYVVCDPCFEETVKDIALNNTLSIQENFIKESKKKIEVINNQLNNLQSRQTAAKYRYNDLFEQSNDLQNMYVTKQKVLNYINMRSNFDQTKHPKIVINPSKGEDINGIENNSQDIVLICHILDKKYLNYFGILAEASRILKINGEILVVEDRDKDIIGIFEKLGLQWQEKGNKVVCRIKKRPI
ncbi:MAG: hypothetical protein WAZ12_04845 [Candidatus Absconditicoccaceae bacterium]